uniref:Ubiquitin-like domain-containing protein n=1 Tax=Pyrodinium bahamense TaxID=73915 RepID=A0A7S0BBY1_9DINO|mmetsp:Transcript_8956/g.24886  ORF Transcript_8956/g.24886 Transcript_8956/m.24886 type:complete len:101 (+) Transcript_8956:53-355(+)
MAAFANTAITIKVLEPAPGDKGTFYWGMVNNPTCKDLFQVPASPDMTVRDLKAAIAKEKGYTVEEQRFLFFGTVLDDDRTLGKCGFNNSDDPLLHMIPKV